MDRTPARRARDGAAFHDRLSNGRVWLVALIPILLLGAILLTRASFLNSRPTAISLAGGASSASPANLMAAAADSIEAATAKGGTGYRFEIVQTSTMVAKAGGPKIPIPDPADPQHTLRMADSYYLNALLEHGVARPDGFWSQMQAGPVEGKAPDWKGALIVYEALVRDGERWRTDGDGWYKAQALPGIGLDPETAGLLPALLRAAPDPKDLPPGDKAVDPNAARTIADTATPAQIPGVVAADGAAFTKLTEPVAYGFDDAGQLISVHVLALNTNMTDFDLVIDTTIVIAYDNVDGLPTAEPVLKAAQS